MADRNPSVIWSADARADISELWDYYVTVAGRRTADKIVWEIGEACLLLR